MGRGRYAGEIPQRSTNSLPRPRGRGRLSEKEKNDKSQFFKKEINVKRQIQLVSIVIFSHLYYSSLHREGLVS